MAPRRENEVHGELLDFFTRHFRPARVGIVGTSDPVGLAIREAQRELTPGGRPSRWSHCFIMGHLRTDRRAPDRRLTQSPYIFESDLHAEIDHLQMRNGAQENWIGKWCRGSVEYAGVIDFLLPEDVVDGVLATALQLVGDHLRYSVGQLLGTWLSMIRERRGIPNPWADPHAMYCSAFVRYCFVEADADFLLDDLHFTHTTPEDIARAGEQSGNLILWGRKGA